MPSVFTHRIISPWKATWLYWSLSLKRVACAFSRPSCHQYPRVLRKPHWDSPSRIMCSHQSRASKKHPNNMLLRSVPLVFVYTFIYLYQNDIFCRKVFNMFTWSCDQQHKGKHSSKTLPKESCVSKKRQKVDKTPTVERPAMSPESTSFLDCSGVFFLSWA